MQREVEYHTSGTVQEKKCNMTVVKTKDNTEGVRDVSWKRHIESLNGLLEYSLNHSLEYQCG